MSDFTKGFALGWLTSGNGGGGGGNSSEGGCLEVFKMILALIGIAIVLFVILFVVSFGLVLHDMGIMWYIGIPFMFGVWDQYISLDTTAGNKMILLPLVHIIAYFFFNPLRELLEEMNPSQIKNKVTRIIGITLHGIPYAITMIIVGMIIIATPITMARTVYYFFVWLF